MSVHEAVTDALRAGTDPRHICEMCSWDRVCVRPPDCTKEQIKAKVEKAQSEQGMMAAALAIASYAGRDELSEVCPIMANALRDNEMGPQLITAIRSVLLADR